MHSHERHSLSASHGNLLSASQSGRTSPTRTGGGHTRPGDSRPRVEGMQRQFGERSSSISPLREPPRPSSSSQRSITEERRLLPSARSASSLQRMISPDPRTNDSRTNDHRNSAARTRSGSYGSTHSLTASQQYYGTAVRNPTPDVSGYQRERVSREHAHTSSHTTSGRSQSPLQERRRSSTAGQHSASYGHSSSSWSSASYSHGLSHGSGGERRASTAAVTGAERSSSNTLAGSRSSSRHASPMHHASSRHSSPLTRRRQEDDEDLAGAPPRSSTGRPRQRPSSEYDF